jgi:hypothetical protein
MAPVSLAYCIQQATYTSGSEFYRAHRPVSVLAQKDDWMTFLATRFLPPEKAGEPWRVLIPINGEETVITPEVIVTRPIFALEGQDETSYDSAYKLTEAIAYAQEAGQIVIADLDDSPYAWNAEYVGRIGGEKITDWSWHDDWLNQCNAVLCSTHALIEHLGPRFPDQTFAYAPNLYDPFRYEVTARFGKTLGSHLFPNARYLTDFEILGAAVTPFLEANPEWTFRHVGEEFRCVNCAELYAKRFPIGHPKTRHFEPDLAHLHGGISYCAECACETYEPIPGDGQLAQYSGIPQSRIVARESVGLPDLPAAMDWSIGVVPLAGNEWNRCKTDGKGFEMAAAGIPFVFLGEHPLYEKAPSLSLDNLPGTPEEYARASSVFRKWAEQVAQEHERDYRSAMHALSTMNLKKPVSL